MVTFLFLFPVLGTNSQDAAAVQNQPSALVLFDRFLS